MNNYFVFIMGYAVGMAACISILFIGYMLGERDENKN